MKEKMIFENEFFVHLQAEVENKQEYLATVLNPNEYLVKQEELRTLTAITNDYVRYLEKQYAASKEIK